MSAKSAAKHQTGYEKWLLKKQKMNQKLRETCEKYSDSVNHTVDTAKFRYVKEHNLLVCLNEKVNYPNKYLPPPITVLTLGRDYYYDGSPVQSHSFTCHG